MSGDADRLNEMLRSAVQLHQTGELDSAEQIYRDILQHRPGNTQTLYLLGTLAHQKGRDEEAVSLLEEALASSPENPACHYNLALVHERLGAPERAAEHYRKALDADPALAGAHINLGKLLYDQGRYEDSLRHFEQAMAHSPESAEVSNNLGNVLRKMGRLAEATEAYRKALELRPGLAEAHNNLGIALRQQFRYQEAISHFLSALEANPGYSEAMTNLGALYDELGRAEEALKQFERALTLSPQHHRAHSNLLYTLAYNVLREPGAMYQAHLEWDKVHGAEGRARVFTHTGARDDPERRLRIGYVSPDLRGHPVSSFFEPLLAAHDSARVETYCYAEVARPDAVTERLSGLADQWRSTVGLDDASLARRIYDDDIDILIDLAGHTAGSRLKAFTYKPAPVQATYLGYFTTTGLTAMDYWISDATLHPMDTVEQTVETIYRLPRCSLCFLPPAEAPPVAHRDASGAVVLGSFNNLSKISARAIALWSEILKAVPDSRLLLKAKQLSSAEVRNELTRRFGAHGIAPERLDLRERTGAVDTHLATYGEVDIALDTVPRTGGATTAEALWMGVPVITLAGGRFIERLSATMLTAVGLPELIATTEPDYVGLALSLAEDHGRRAGLRSDLRQRMAASPLCDGAALARAFEEAYREMWTTSLKQPI